MRRSSIAVATVGIISLALSACAGAEPEKAGNRSAEGLKEVVIATQAIVDSAPLYLGVKKGLFEKEGIDLKIETSAGGAAVVPGVVSGDFDFGRGNMLSTMLAADRGLDLKCIANANTTAGTPDFGAVVVLEDSPIKTVADLGGKTVSVNTLSNIGDTTIRAVVEDAGGDPSGINFVEVGFSEAPAVLESKQVDAAWILDPFLTEALAHGARVLSYNFSEFHPELDISCVFASQALVESDPELVGSFQTAMNEALEYSQAHPDEVRDIVSTYTKIDPTVLAEIVLPVFKTEFSREAAQKLGEKATEYGTLSKEPNLDELLPPQ
jgi:NitT/TauT family transport system substrate-binding protein